MINLNYLQYFVDAAELGSVAQASKKNLVSSSAISQAIRWLEDWYQVELVLHGKNRFVVTQKGQQIVKESKALLENMTDFNERVKEIAQPGSGMFKLSMPQSIANSIVAKAIKSFNDQYPAIDLQVRIGTSHRCKELMQEGKVKYSLSIDNVEFDAHKEEVYQGKFVFISAADDKRSPEEAGFILTEDTKEVIELRANYYKQYKKEIPVHYAISSWGVITNMAINGNGIAYIPDYYLRGIDRSSYRIRKIKLPIFQYAINFYYAKDVEFSKEHAYFVKQIKKLIS